MFYSIKTKSCEEACNKITWGVCIFGMLPMNKRFQLDLRLVAVSFLTMMVLTANSAYWMTSTLMKLEGLYHYIIYLTRKFLETLTVITITVQLTLKRNRFRSIVYNLKSVESALSEVGERWSWSLHPKHYLRYPVLTALLIAVYFKSDTYFWAVMHVEIFFIAIYVSHISAFYDMLKYCMILIRTTEECVSHTKLYAMIENSFEDLNALNGIGIFLVLVSYFMNLLHQLYQLFNIYNISSIRYTDIFSAATYYSSFILWIIFNFNGISSEVSNHINNTSYSLFKNESHKFIFAFRRFSKNGNTIV